MRFATPHGSVSLRADAVVLALGGGSWAKLGSDGSWVPLLLQRGIPVAALQPSNCGFDVPWSEHFRARFAGHPVKSVVVSFTGSNGVARRHQGEFTVTQTGVEGALIYALSAPLREEIAATGAAIIHVDLAPGKELGRVIEELSRPRGSRSMANHLRSRAGIQGVKAGLLRELAAAQDFADPGALATATQGAANASRRAAPSR